MILPPGATGDTEAVDGVVRVHGGSSQGYEKKSYGLTLEAPAQWLGMRKSTQWVLNAAFVDRSLMRHKLSYDLFRSLSSVEGKRHAVASRFVEVKLNDRYNGAYLLMERVDRALLDLRSYDSATTTTLPSKFRQGSMDLQADEGMERIDVAQRHFGDAAFHRAVGRDQFVDHSGVRPGSQINAPLRTDG